MRLVGKKIQVQFRSKAMGEFPNKETQFKPGQSGNPAGKPKGAKHISTYIQEALTDENFELKLKDGSIFKGMPMQAIIKTAVAKSMSGDTRAMEWLAKHGYGEKLRIEIDDPIKKILGKFEIKGEDVAEADSTEA